MWQQDMIFLYRKTICNTTWSELICVYVDMSYPILNTAHILKSLLVYFFKDKLVIELVVITASVYTAYKTSV